MVGATGFSARRHSAHRSIAGTLWRRPSWLALVLGLGSLVGVMAEPTRAQAEADWHVEGGLFIAYHFGAGANHFGVGIEARALYAQRPLSWCWDRRSRSVGGVGRISWVGGDQARVTLGARAGIDRDVSYGLELGGGYRLGREPGSIVHVMGEASLAGVGFLREAALANAGFLRFGYAPSVDAMASVGMTIVPPLQGCGIAVAEGPATMAFA